MVRKLQMKTLTVHILHMKVSSGVKMYITFLNKRKRNIKHDSREQRQFSNILKCCD